MHDRRPDDGASSSGPTCSSARTPARLIWRPRPARFRSFSSAAPTSPGNGGPGRGIRWSSATAYRASPATRRSARWPTTPACPACTLTASTAARCGGGREHTRPSRRTPRCDDLPGTNDCEVDRCHGETAANLLIDRSSIGGAGSPWPGSFGGDGRTASWRSTRGPRNFWHGSERSGNEVLLARSKTFASPGVAGDRSALPVTGRTLTPAIRTRDDVKRAHSASENMKAPIYWLLQSSKKNYALWLYYHRLDKDILFKARQNYVESEDSPGANPPRFAAVAEARPGSRRQGCQEDRQGHRTPGNAPRRTQGLRREAGAGRQAELRQPGEARLRRHLRPRPERRRRPEHRPALGTRPLEGGQELLGRTARRQVRVVVDGQAAAKEGAGKITEESNHQEGGDEHENHRTRASGPADHRGPQGSAPVKTPSF